MGYVIHFLYVCWLSVLKWLTGSDVYVKLRSVDQAGNAQI